MRLESKMMARVDNLSTITLRPCMFHFLTPSFLPSSTRSPSPTPLPLPTRSPGRHLSGHGHPARVSLFLSLSPSLSLYLSIYLSIYISLCLARSQPSQPARCPSSLFPSCRHGTVHVRSSRLYPSLPPCSRPFSPNQGNCSFVRLNTLSKQRDCAESVRGESKSYRNHLNYQSAAGQDDSNIT